MRIAHLGNTANDGYLYAKIAGRVGTESIVVLHSPIHIINCPEWEDGEFEFAGAEDMARNNADATADFWQTVKMKNGFTRPDWLYDWQDAASAPLARERDVALLTGPQMVHWRGLFNEGVPWLAFSHGSLRKMVPQPTFPVWEQSQRGLKHADGVLITNADCVRCARYMGLSPHRYRFLPHPVDDEKYCPVETPSPLRAALLAEHNADCIILAPARIEWDQSSMPFTSVKGYPQFLAAFRNAARKSSRRVLLLLTSWGRGVAEAQSMLSDMGDQVVFLPPMPKFRLIDYIRAADVIADQFAYWVGSFGLTTCEALACGKPVLTFIDESLHEWCLEEPPPIIKAFPDDVDREHIVEHIEGQLLRIIGGEIDLDAVGKQSRRWIEKHHSSELIANRLIDICTAAQAGQDFMHIPARV